MLLLQLQGGLPLPLLLLLLLSFRELLLLLLLLLLRACLLLGGCWCWVLRELRVVWQLRLQPTVHLPSRCPAPYPPVPRTACKHMAHSAQAGGMRPCWACGRDTQGYTTLSSLRGAEV